MQLPAIQTLAIDHVGIATADLEATLAIHRDLFGLVETHRESNPEQQVIEVMLAPAPDRAPSADIGPTQLQILAPLSDDSPIATFLDRRGPGLQHLALRVADIAAASDQLAERGVRLLYPQPRQGTAGSKINFLHPRDAGRVLIELVEPATRHTD